MLALSTLLLFLSLTSQFFIASSSLTSSPLVTTTTTGAQESAKRENGNGNSQHQISSSNLLVVNSNPQVVNSSQQVKLNSSLDNSSSSSVGNSSSGGVLEPRVSSFVRDILDRLHALDNDIGKLLVNSTSMYAPNDESLPFHESSRGGEKFTELLGDLDSLQDEIGGLINNATRTRQYNMVVRLRPLNNLLYRIRHNLHLIRNSLVAINTVSHLEKIGNSVLDSTLSAFLKPDANLNEEVGDSGNYDINLDNMDDIAATSSNLSQTTASPSSISTKSQQLVEQRQQSSTTKSTAELIDTTTRSTTSSPATSTTNKSRQRERGTNRRRTTTTTLEPTTTYYSEDLAATLLTEPI